MRNKLIISLAILLLSTFGCGGAKFSCTENLEGIKCDPPSRIYEQVLIQQSQKVSSELSLSEKSSLKDKETAIIADKLSERLLGKPLRVPPKIIKIWIAPWEDSDGDLHSGEVIYSEISPTKGRWIIGERQVEGLDVDIKNVNTGITESFPEKVKTIESDTNTSSTQKDSAQTRQRIQPQSQQNRESGQPRVRKE